MTRLTAVQVGSGWFPEIAGGLNRYFRDLLKHLPATGIDCHALVIGTSAVDDDTGGRVHAYARANTPLPIRTLAARRAAARVWENVPDDRPAVQVTHFAPYAYLLARPPGRRPRVVHFHGPWAAESQREGAGRLSVLLKRQIEISAYRRADRLIVLSNAFRDLLIRDYAVDPERISIIPGGVDIGRFGESNTISRAEARRRLGWPTDRPILLAVRRLASRMGLESLVDAMASVRRRVPEALCIIAGRGRLKDELSARITMSGLAEHVKLIGFLSDADLPAAYRAADVSIMPTEALEGFGLSAIESLAAGTPVLVSRVGGLPEVVAPFGDRLLLPDAADARADRVTRVLSDPQTLPSAEDCMAYAKSRFDWTIVAEKIAECYRTTPAS